MPERDSDVKRFHQFEYAGWQRAADAYHRYYGELTALIAEHLLDALGNRSSIKLLDIATGPGYAAAAARLRGWSAIGIDFSESMINKARSLYPQVDFRVGDAHALDFQESEFDAVVMNFGILHLARPETALREIHRVLRTDGRLSFSAWDKVDKSIALGIAFQAIEELCDSSEEVPDEPSFFRFSDPQECVNVLEHCGFCGISLTEVPLRWTLPSAESLFDAFYGGTARIGGLLRAQPAANLIRVREAIRQGASAFSCNSHIEIPMQAIVVSAAKAH